MNEIERYLELEDTYLYFRIIADTRFTFHNIGQGLFYTGEIYFKLESDDDKVCPFIFVYDCGSKKEEYIRHAIKSFRNDVEFDKINLLVISHFHADHVNGLVELINNFKQIDLVVIPYYNPIERLIIALMNPNQSEEYYRFLADPLKYLLVEKGNKIKKVIVIGKPGRMPENTKNSDKDSKKPFLGNISFKGYIPVDKIRDKISNIKNNKIELDIENLEDNNELLKELINEYGEDQIETWKKHGKLYLKTHNGYIGLLDMWIFTFFNYMPQNYYESLKKFKECIEKHIGEVSNDFDKIKKIIESIENKRREKDKSDEIESIKDCYDKLYKSGELKNFNNTSLILFHSPINYHHIENIGFYPIIMRFFTEIRNRSNHNFAQFLTGDIDLNYRYDEIINHFNKKSLERVLTSLIPHHGSKKNWNSKILEDLRNCKFWIACAGKTNTYGHPSKKVFEEIMKSMRCVFWINEEGFWFSLTGKVIWKGIIKEKKVIVY